MTGKDLFIALGDISHKYYDEAEYGTISVAHEHKSLRRPLLIAAVIAMALLLVGCAVVYALSLQDMKVDEEIITQEEWHGPAGEYAPATEWVSSILSLQGFNGSPEQLAMKEWLDFQNQYDQDYALRNANNFNESGVPEQYNLTYGCYTFEMMDKLNEILDKYQLEPLGAIIHFDRWESPLLNQALQMEGLCRPGFQVDSMAGYFFPEGSFHAEFHQALEAEQNSRIISFTYAKTHYLYPNYFAVKDLELWEQWHYTTADGTDVLLATYENALLIICDCGDGFIHISTENAAPYLPYDASAEPMTRQKAEQIADSFNYSIRPQPCDPAKVESMRADYPEPERQISPYIGFRIAPDGRWFPREEISDSFEHYVSFLLENDDNPENLEYCIVDLDSDGKEEIVIGWHDTGRIWQVTKMEKIDEDSKTEEVSIRYVRGHLYEGPILENIEEQRYDDSMTHHRYEDFNGNLIQEFRYNAETKTWEKWVRKIQVNGFDEDVWETIPESEFRTYRDSLVPLSLDMKPLREFSMEE